MLFAAESAPVPNRCGRHNQERHAGLSLLDRFPWSRTGYLKCRDGVPCPLGRSCSARQHWNDERLFPEYDSGSDFHYAVGTWYGGCGRRMRYFFIQLCCLSVFLRPPICETWKYVCLYQSAEIPDQKGDCHGSMRRWHTSLHPEFAQRNRDDNSQQFHLRVRRRRSSCYGNLLQNLHGANAGVHGILSGDHAVSQLQFCLRGSKTHESVDSLCY